MAPQILTIHQSLEVAYDEVFFTQAATAADLNAAKFSAAVTVEMRVTARDIDAGGLGLSGHNGRRDKHERGGESKFQFHGEDSSCFSGAGFRRHCVMPTVRPALVVVPSCVCGFLEVTACTSHIHPAAGGMPTK